MAPGFCCRVLSLALACYTAQLLGGAHNVTYLGGKAACDGMIGSGSVCWSGDRLDLQSR